MRYARALLAVSLLVVVSVSPAVARIYDGRDFVLGFLPGVDENHDPLVVEVQLSSDVGATVRVEYPMGAPTFTRTVWVPQHAAINVVLPNAAARGWLVGVPSRNAVRVYTTDPVPARFGAYLVNRTRLSSDSAQALPVPSLGLEYVVVAAFDGPPKISNEFVVVATEPSTTVTVEPTTFVEPAYPALVPFSVVLDAGEGFLGRNDPSLSPGLTGTIVTADKPVVVTNGDVCAFIPAGFGACDHIFEVALPTRHWGLFHPVRGLPERGPGTMGTRYRITAAQNATQVLLNGFPWTVLNRGQFTTVGCPPAGCEWSATNPVLVTQYETGAPAVPADHPGDPAMGTMLPIEQWGRARSFGTVGAGQFARHWVTILAEADDAAAGSVTLDGTPVPASAFTPVKPGSAYVATVQQVGPGTHRTTCRGPHQVTVEGHNTRDSYLHPVAGRVPIDHYLCHRGATNVKAPSVTLSDAFGSGSVGGRATQLLCAPADKNGEGVTDAVTHLVGYRIVGLKTPRDAVQVSNQFGTLTLDLRATTTLLVPAAKAHPPAPFPPPPDPTLHDVDHYRCLAARVTRGTPDFVARTVAIADQFVSGQAIVKRPTRLCLPTDKNGEGVKRPDDALLCYRVAVEPKSSSTGVLVTDQFGSQRIPVNQARELCVPSVLAPGGCCEPRITRCRIGGVDAGPCDLPDLVAACLAAGGDCQSRPCELQCGDGVLDPWCCEECDDGTRLEGDGCSSRCKAQPCCITQPQRCAVDARTPCDDAGDCQRAGLGGPCVTLDCAALCGNGTVEDFCCEPCDDGIDCALPCGEDEPCTPEPCRCVDEPDFPCGDGQACPSGGPCVCYDCNTLCSNGLRENFCCEYCDPGILLEAGTCSSDCHIVTCAPTPCFCQDTGSSCLTGADCPTGACVCQDCTALCGDGIIEPWCCEDCDDGTRLDGDGCSATCKAQDCCIVQPTRCAGDPLVPCDEDADCAAQGIGPCVSVACDFACGDGRLQSFCCEQCDDGSTCYAYPHGQAPPGGPGGP